MNAAAVKKKAVKKKHAKKKAVKKKKRTALKRPKAPVKKAAEVSVEEELKSRPVRDGRQHIKQKIRRRSRGNASLHWHVC
jgi:hypothetical protein